MNINTKFSTKKNPINSGKEKIHLIALNEKSFFFAVKRWKISQKFFSVLTFEQSFINDKLLNEVGRRSRFKM